jgi:hypothetical protein
MHQFWCRNECFPFRLFGLKTYVWFENIYNKRDMNGAVKNRMKSVWFLRSSSVLSFSYVVSFCSLRRCTITICRFTILYTVCRFRMKWYDQNRHYVRIFNAKTKPLSSQRIDVFRRTNRFILMRYFITKCTNISKLTEFLLLQSLISFLLFDGRRLSFAKTVASFLH